MTMFLVNGLFGMNPEHIWRMRCAYPPYMRKWLRYVADALRLFTLRENMVMVFGGCVALIHPAPG